MNLHACKAPLSLHRPPPLPDQRCTELKPRLLQLWVGLLLLLFPGPTWAGTPNPATPLEALPQSTHGGYQDAQEEEPAGIALPSAAQLGAPGASVLLGMGNNEPTIAVDPHNPLHLAVATYLGIRVSTDGGVIFQPRVNITAPAGFSTGSGGDSSLGYDSQGRLFWTFLLRNIALGGFDVFVVQCNPNTGAILPGYPVNLTSSAGVANDNVNHSHDKSWLAVDASATSPFRDRLYVVWTDFTPGGSVIRTTSSANQGATWTAALALSGGGEGFVWPSQNTVAPNGDVYASYHSQPGFSSNNPDGVSGKIFVLRSINGGANYPQKNLAYAPGQADITFNVQSGSRKIPRTQFWLQGSAQPQILADPNTPGRIYVIANDQPNPTDFADVYIVTSTDNGGTWSAPARIDSGATGTFHVMPSAAIDAVSGCIVVTYYDNRRGQTNAAGNFLLDVFATTSGNGGATFTPDFQINTTAFNPDLNAPCRYGPSGCGGVDTVRTLRIGEYNGAAIGGGVAFAVWTGNNAGGSQDTVFNLFAGCVTCTLTCPATVTRNNDPGQCGATVNYPAPTASAGCGLVTSSPPSGSFFPVGTTKITSTSATGGSCSFDVVVKDAEPPKVNCPPDLTVCNDPGQCSAVATYVSSATDNCGLASFACSPPSGSVFPKGTTTVTCTAVDTSGNTSSCSFKVTVNDCEPPQVTCPPDITVCNDPGQCSAQVFFTVTATDNCALQSLVSTPPSGSIFPKGTNTVTSVATDTSGNTSSCTFTVIVNDCEAPQVACRPAENPSGKKIPVAGKNPRSGKNPDGFYQVLAKDNCDPTASLKIYVKDSAEGPCGGTFAAGPYAVGTIIKLTQSPGHAGVQPMAGVVAAHVHTRGEPVLVVTDSSGNTGCQRCFVPPPPK